MRRLLLRAAAGLFVLLLIVAAAGVAWYVYEDRQGYAAWRAYEAEARARGVKLTAAEYLSPSIPDSENFAATPLFHRAMAAADANPAEAPFDDPLTLPAEPAPPPFSSPETQQRIDLAKWRDYFVRAALVQEDRERSDAEVVLRALDSYAQPWEELRVAAQRPKTRFPIAWERGFEMPLPHLGVLLSAAKLSALRIEAQLARGDAGAALAELHLGLRFARAFEQEPVAISGLVYVAILNQVEAAVWSGMAAGLWSDAALREIDAELKPLRLLTQYCFVRESERAISNTYTDVLLAKSRSERAEMSRELAELVDLGPSPVLGPPGWMKLSQVWLNRHTDEVIARIDPDAERFHQTPLIHDPENITGWLDEQRYHSVRHSARVLGEVEIRYLATHSRTQFARIACAVERFRIATGATPPSLEALVPEYLPKVPHDVMDGAPLRYRRDDDQSYLLYSVAMNGRDDGGTVGKRLGVSRQLDWIWPSTAAPTVQTPRAP